MDDLELACPRCGVEVRQRFAGPCRGCREQLRVAYAADPRVVQAVAYEPKVNVTPNQIASKD